MYEKLASKRLFLLLITTLLITVPATALSIEIADSPVNSDTVSNDTENVRVVNITESGEMLNRSDIGDDFRLNYTYNKTGGETGQLEHLAGGYWYADFLYNSSEGDYINYSVQERFGTEDRAETSEQLTAGALSLELMSELNNRLSPGEQVSLRVNITDLVGQNPETNADVQAYFTNGTHTLELQGLNNQDGSEYYNSGVNTPSNYGGTYVLHINASESDSSAKGSVSVPVRMEPPMTGEITYLDSSSGCNNSSFFRECERGADISTGYSVEGATPDSVEFSIEAMNRTSGEWETQYSTQMTNNSVYEVETDIPDLNTTAYERDIRMVYNASSEEVNAVEKYDISVRDYQISFGAASAARQGSDYDLEIVFEKYFSSQPLDESRIDAEVNITNATDTQYQYQLADFDYSNGIFQRDVQVGSEWPEGTYQVEVRAHDIYNNTKTAQNNFFVQEVNRTFDVVQEIDEEVITAGVYEFNTTVENQGSSELNLSTNVSEDIEEFASVPDFVQVSGDEEQNITVQFNLTGMRMEDRSGELMIEDQGGFNETADIDLEIPGCDYREGPYCLEGELNDTRDERGYALENFDLYYLANESDSSQVEPSFDGNLSEVGSFAPASVEMNSSNNEQVFTANYSAMAPGYYTGSLEIGSLSVPVEFTSDVELTDLSISVTDSIDLGTVPEDGSASADIEVENTGDVMIESVSFESLYMTVSAESSEVGAGSTETFELDISEISREGAITVTAQSSGQEVSEDIEVQVDTVQDLAQQASDLRDELNDLQSEVTSTQNQNTLNTASYNITEIQNAYNAGNYEEAQQMYTATEASLEEVRSSLNTESTDPSESSPSDNSTEPEPSQSQEGEGQGGSTLLIIIAIVVFVLLLVGFIIYTSYVPEEGDPLYGVLGQ